MVKNNRQDYPKIDGFLGKLEKYMQKADDIANAPRKRAVEKRQAEKESLYASFNSRSFAAIIDLGFIFAILMPVLLNLSIIFYGGSTNPLGSEIMKLDNAALAEAFFTSRYFYGLMLDYVFHFIVFGLIFLWFWQKAGCTPGKWLMRMRIVDVASFKKPTFKQFLIRYCAYIISIIPLTLGFMWIMWSKNNQGWHDIIANTAVIKVNHWKFGYND